MPNKEPVYYVGIRTREDADKMEEEVNRVLAILPRERSNADAAEILTIALFTLLQTAPPELAEYLITELDPFIKTLRHVVDDAIRNQN